MKSKSKLQKDNEDYAKLLKLTVEQLQDFPRVKNAYRKQMAFVLKNKSERIKLNRAHSQVYARLFNHPISSLKKSIIQGDLQTLRKILNNDQNLLNKKDGNYPIIYLAVRSGHQEIVQFLLKSGCDLNFKGHKSTPMHCASFYGHYSLIPLLLMYGVPIDIKNVYGNLPIEEAANPEIQKLLTIVKYNKIRLLNQSLLKTQIGHSIINIQYKSSIVCKKIIIRNYFKLKNQQDYINAFHGTSYQNLESILRFGLRKPGETVNGKKIDIVKGHIHLGVFFNGKEDWSNAIFVTPSIYYAGDPIYSKQFIENTENCAWLPIVQAKVKKGSYTEHDHTLQLYFPPNSQQPEKLEYRVSSTLGLHKNLIMRSQFSQAVVVVAAIFIKMGFLQQQRDYKLVTDLILNSKEQIAFNKLNA